MGFIGVLGASFALLHPSLAVSLGAAFAEVDGILSSYKTLQPTGQCLKFMHIPKTGGTSIEQITLSYPKAERPYRSYMEFPYDNAAERQAKYFKMSHMDELSIRPMTAGELFNQSHREAFSYQHILSMAMVHFPYSDTLSRDGICTTHAPPLEGTQARTYFSDGCTNFCVVREPLQRFLSTFKFDLPILRRTLAHLGVRCSPESFDVFVRLEKAKFDSKNYYDSACHFTPQVQMVYGAESKEASTQKFCHRVLRQEHLSAEYDSLMKEFGRDGVQLNNVKMFTSSSGKQCDLHINEVWQSTKDMIYEMYRADYDAFNYTRPLNRPSVMSG